MGREAILSRFGGNRRGSREGSRPQNELDASDFMMFFFVFWRAQTGPGSHATERGDASVVPPRRQMAVRPLPPHGHVQFVQLKLPPHQVTASVAGNRPPSSAAGPNKYRKHFVTASSRLEFEIKFVAVSLNDWKVI